MDAACTQTIAQSTNRISQNRRVLVPAKDMLELVYDLWSPYQQQPELTDTAFC